MTNRADWTDAEWEVHWAQESQRLRALSDIDLLKEFAKDIAVSALEEFLITDDSVDDVLERRWAIADEIASLTGGDEAELRDLTSPSVEYVILQRMARKQ